MTNQEKELIPKYTLGISSRLTDIPVHSIRQYIDKGLLIPYRTETNRHLFSDVDIERLKCIKDYLDVQGLNVAGIKKIFSLIPCWAIKPCNPEDRINCQAYLTEGLPCWEASEKGPKCLNTDCRTCTVYRLPEKCSSLKSILRDYIK
jgi:MerR family transcriptional regulator, heat shock protein HspR